MGHDPYDDLNASVDPAMAIVTMADGAARSGCLVGFHSQSSIQPPRYSVWISKANHTYELVARASHLAVHLLTDADHDLAELFGHLTGDEVDKFSRCDTTEGPGGVPLLDRCRNRIVGPVVDVHAEHGDHVCVTIACSEVSSGGRFTPLRLSDVGDITPGHATDE